MGLQMGGFCLVMMLIMMSIQPRVRLTTPYGVCISIIVGVSRGGGLSAINTGTTSSFFFKYSLKNRAQAYIFEGHVSKKSYEMTIQDLYLLSMLLLKQPSSANPSCLIVPIPNMCVS